MNLFTREAGKGCNATTLYFAPSSKPNLWADTFSTERTEPENPTFSCSRTQNLFKFPEFRYVIPVWSLERFIRNFSKKLVVSDQTITLQFVETILVKFHWKLHFMKWFRFGMDRTGEEWKRGCSDDKNNNKRNGSIVTFSPRFRKKNHSFLSEIV